MNTYYFVDCNPKRTKRYEVYKQTLQGLEFIKAFISITQAMNYKQMLEAKR